MQEGVAHLFDLQHLVRAKHNRITSAQEVFIYIW